MIWHSSHVLMASVTLDAAFGIAPVRPRLFGSFVEHLGRCVYTGIHDPGAATGTVRSGWGSRG
jgi:alpha-L-arabinofuranosidase